ncbi:MAG: sugar O-acetyltransferase [Clostridia bacterium]
MTEKEKMLSEKLFISDKELFLERQYAKELIFDLNNLRPNKLKEKNKILSKLLSKIGSNIFIEPPFRCDYGYNIEIGDNFYSNYNLTILDSSKVIIGNNVLIGPNVGIYTAGHPIDVTDRVNNLEYGKSIIIKDNVWIGGSVVICPGVIIGKNSIIGAGSVVTKNIAKNVVAVGNPCKVIKNI